MYIKGIKPHCINKAMTKLHVLYSGELFFIHTVKCVCVVCVFFIFYFLKSCNLWNRMTVFHSRWGLTCVSVLSCTPGLWLHGSCGKQRTCHHPHKLCSKSLFIPHPYLISFFFPLVTSAFQGTASTNTQLFILYKILKSCRLCESENLPERLIVLFPAEFRSEKKHRSALL